jgi:RNA polymerase sigma factor (sigma-70 family)
VSPEPLEDLINRMRTGDLRAVEQLLLAHEPELRLIVRRRLSPRLRAKFDSLDVVQSVWARVLGAVRGSGRQIISAAHLRNFLVQVTQNCLIDRLRHYRVALEREQSLPEVGATSVLASGQPRPSEVAQANELWDRLLTICPPEHHELLRLKRQGLPLAAIAASTGLHEDSVRRIFRKLARKLAVPIELITSEE